MAIRIHFKLPENASLSPTSVAFKQELSATRSIMVSTDRNKEGVCYIDFTHVLQACFPDRIRDVLGKEIFVTVHEVKTPFKCGRIQDGTTFVEVFPSKKGNILDIRGETLHDVVNLYRRMLEGTAEYDVEYDVGN